MHVAAFEPCTADAVTKHGHALWSVPNVVLARSWTLLGGDLAQNLHAYNSWKLSNLCLGRFEGEAAI